MKTCTICKEDLPRSQFNKNKSKKDGLQNFCRECGCKRSRRYYKENRQKHLRVIRKRNDAYRAEIREWIDSLKSKCCICPENEKVCLDWHHLDPSQKEFNISWAISAYRKSKRTLLAEIEKCVCVCANCHRKIHAGIIQVPPAVFETATYELKARCSTSEL